MNNIQGVYTLSLTGWIISVVGKEDDPAQYVVIVIRLLSTYTVQASSAHAFILKVFLPICGLSE